MTTARRRPGRLTDTQLGLLSTAAQRDDQLVVPEETMPEKAAAAALKPLLKHGLIAEVRVKRGQPHWHRNDANQRMGLRITAAGRERLGLAARAADEAHDQSPRVGRLKRKGSSAPESSSRRSVPRTPGNAASSKPAPGRPGTKRALIASLLSRKEGASLVRADDCHRLVAPHHPGGAHASAPDGLHPRAVQEPRGGDGLSPDQRCRRNDEG